MLSIVILSNNRDGSPFPLVVNKKGDSPSFLTGSKKGDVSFFLLKPSQSKKKKGTVPIFQPPSFPLVSL